MVFRFCDRPDPRRAIGLTAYLHTRSGERTIGYVRQPSTTKVVDLTRSETELMRGCNESTAYEIRRAERDGVAFDLEQDRDRFLAMYNAFARAKGIATASRADLDPYGEALVITRASIGGEAVAYHVYVCDREGGRVRLTHSASTFRASQDSKARNLIGRANRFLHFRDMLYFKRQGYARYDLGGYVVNASDPEVEQISRFKDGFGGELVEETNFISVPHFAYRLCKRYLAAPRGRSGRAEGDAGPS
jgi:lipid II:glycine glycyltransferase (peptidoglycan interpeptide bridge formation enzyme)